MDWMGTSNSIRKFLFPTLNKRYLTRLVFLGLGCYLIFGHLLIPLRIEGYSMEPTYQNGSFAFCWRLQYLLSPPQRSDIVTVRFSGRRVMLLKRIIALPGDTVAFREGVLYRNGKLVEEAYVRHRSSWNLAPRIVKPGYVYVVGDNRGTVMARHRFGQVRIDRVIGGVLL